MQRLTPVLTYLWLTALGLQFVLGIGIFVHKLWRKFPVFAIYSLTNLLASAGLYSVRTTLHSSYAYFYSYWVCEGITLLLGFGVLYEIFEQLLSSHPALQRLASRLFWWVFSSLIVMGALVIYSHSATSQHPLVAGVVVIEEAIRVIEVGLLVFLFIFSSAFGLHWRQPVFGIALGLGIFATVELVGVAIVSNMGVIASAVFNPIRALTFDSCLLIWIGYILAPERVTVGELPKREQLEQWNQAVLELIGQ